MEFKPSTKPSEYTEHWVPVISIWIELVFSHTCMSFYSLIWSFIVRHPVILFQSMRSREIKMQSFLKIKFKIVLRVSHGEDDCMHIVKVSSPDKASNYKYNSNHFNYSQVLVIF